MNSPSFTFFRLIKLSGICLAFLLASQNVSAFELNNVNNVNNKKFSTNLSYGNLINKLPKLLVFEERDAAYMVGVIKNEYLTFYSDKNIKLKATYASGAYFIKYTSSW